MSVLLTSTLGVGCTKTVTDATSLVSQNAHLTEIYCFKDQHQCASLSDAPFFDTSIQYQIRFAAGTDYQKSWQTPNLQVNKLFGATDCQQYGDSRHDSAMIGFRQIPGTDTIELLSYSHKDNRVGIDGLNYRFAHITTVNRYVKLHVGVSVLNQYYRYQVNGNNEVVMDRKCGDSTFNGRVISTWFGGQASAPNDMTIDIDNLTKMESTFPKNLSISDRDGSCESVADPVQMLKNHPSGILGQYTVGADACTGSLDIQYLGCAYSDNATATRPIFKYRIKCLN